MLEIILQLHEHRLNINFCACLGSMQLVVAVLWFMQCYLM